jgi:hypothetical protein
MGACFAFGFYSTIYIFQLNLALRVLAGVVCAVVAVGAELYFLIKHSIAEHE